MKKKVLYFAGIIATCSIGLNIHSCGEPSPPSTSSTENTAVASTKSEEEIIPSFFLNEKELQKAQEELQNMDIYKGKELQVFQDIQFYGGQYENKIEIEIQNPAKPENIDHYEYANGKWSEAQAVQLSGEGNMNDNLTPLKNIKFETVAKIAKIWEEKLQTIPEAKTKLDFISFHNFVTFGERYWSANSIESQREKYKIEFNLDGSLKAFKKQ